MNIVGSESPWFSSIQGPDGKVLVNPTGPSPSYLSHTQSSRTSWEKCGSALPLISLIGRESHWGNREKHWSSYYYPLLSGCCLVNSDFNAIRNGQVHPNRSPVSPTLRVLAPCQGQKTNSWMETSTPDGATKKLVEVDLHRLSMLHPSELQKYLHPHGT